MCRFKGEIFLAMDYIPMKCSGPEVDKKHCISGFIVGKIFSQKGPEDVRLQVGLLVE
jgi:hypothetical protein